jgi:hypothetical protein
LDYVMANCIGFDWQRHPMQSVSGFTACAVQSPYLPTFEGLLFSRRSCGMTIAVANAGMRSMSVSAVAPKPPIPPFP